MQPERWPDDGPAVTDEPYVAFLPPGTAARPSPYSVEGYLNGIGDFAIGAARARGWRRLVAKVLVIALLLPVLIACLQGVLTLARMLLGG